MPTAKLHLITFLSTHNYIQPFLIFLEPMYKRLLQFLLSYQHVVVPYQGTLMEKKQQNFYVAKKGKRVYLLCYTK